MKNRLSIQHDILSDYGLIFTKALKLPTFSIDDKIFIKRITLIVDNAKIVKVFYPIFPPDKHIYEILDWLKENYELSDENLEVFKTLSELNLGRLTGRHSTFIASRTRGYKFISIQYPLYPLPLEERI